MSAVWNSSERNHPCVKWHGTYTNMAVDKESLIPVLAETMRKRKKIKKLQEEAESLAGMHRSERRQKWLNEIGSLLSEQSRTKWPSFMEAMCGEEGVVGKESYSMITTEPLQNLRLEV